MKTQHLFLSFIFSLCFQFFSPQLFAQCSISNVTASLTSCSEEEFDVDINFNYSDVTNQFTINGNGTNYGTFSYTDLPITLQNLDADCLTEYEFIIADVIETDCSGFVGLGIVCCENICILSNLELSTDGCMDNEVQLTIDFDYISSSSTFMYYIDNVIPLEGEYNYSDLPLTLQVTPNGLDDILVIIEDSEGPYPCGIEDFIANPCASNSECEITTLDFGDNPACIDSNIVTSWLIDGENLSEVGFDIFIDGEFQFFIAYEVDSWYDFELEAPDSGTALDEVFVLTICDNDNSDCCISWDMENPCYEPEECVFTNLILDSSECQEEAFDLVIDFDYTGTTNVFFELLIFDQFNEVVVEDLVAFVDLPLTISIGNTSSQYFIVSIFENFNESCNIDGEFGNPCFDEVGDCFIGGLEVIQSDCSGDYFNVEINFQYNNTSDQFTVSGNGNSYGTYNYVDLPITIEELEGDCDTQFEFVVHDINNNDCSSDIEYGVVCCEEEVCSIYSIDFGQNPICENGIIVTEWFIFAENTSEVGFDIFIDGDFITFVAFEEEGPYYFDIEASSAPFFTIMACDNDNADCCYTWELENPCYEEETECEFSGLVIESTECDNGQFDLILDFEYSGTTNDFFDYILYGPQNEVILDGFAEFAQLPLSIDIADTDSEYFLVSIFENDNDGCSIIGEFFNPCFEENQSCDISNVIAIPSECNDAEEFSVTIDFEYSNTDGQFMINGNGMNYGLFNYSDLPIILEGFSADCETQYEFIIQDAENDECTDFAGVGPVCCEAEVCSVYSIDFGQTPICENGMIITEWFIFAENTSEVGFDIFINDEFIIFVEFNDDGPYNFDFVAPDTQNFWITACDNDNADCCYTWELENPCYEEIEECQMTTLDFGANPVCEGGLIITDWLIDGENTSEIGYDIFINGTFQLFVEYEQDSWYDFDIEAPETEFFTMTVCDNDNADCCIDWELENPCFEPPVGDCFIDDVTATVIACEGNVFDVLIDFEYGDTSDQFIINGNGNSYGTFLYSDLPVTLTGLEADCTTEFEFVIHDVNDNDCTAAVDYGTICCEDLNDIQEIAITTVVDGDIIVINVDIIISLLSGCDLTVYMDGELYIQLSGETTNFSVGPYECGTDEVISFSIVNTCTDESEEFVIDLSDIECTTVVQDLEVSNILQWNQTQSQFEVNQSIDGNYDLQLFGIDGSLISKKSNLIPSEVIAFNCINSGIYLVRLVERNTGKIGMKKVFIFGK